MGGAVQAKERAAGMFGKRKSRCDRGGGVKRSMRID